VALGGAAAEALLGLNTQSRSTSPKRSPNRLSRWKSTTVQLLTKPAFKRSSAYAALVTRHLDPNRRTFQSTGSGFLIFQEIDLEIEK